MFFHEIWPYHHHQALDLYPDLKARHTAICAKPGLWTVAPAEQAGGAETRALPTMCQAAIDAGMRGPERSRPGQSATTPDTDQRNEYRLRPSAPLKNRAVWRNQGLSPRHGPMLHVEQKKRPGRIPGVIGSTWNRRHVRAGAASPRDATSRCWTHAPAPRSSSRAAG